MKFSCPYCRKECDFMDLQLSGDLRAVIAMSDGFGRIRGLVWAYAELFGITPLHAKAKKLRLILEEMKRLVDAGGFSYRRQLYRISIEGIVEALNIAGKKSFPDPLDSHNYLKKIMITIADREAKDAGRAAEKGLRTREAKAMAGIRDVDEPPSPQREAPAAHPLPSRERVGVRGAVERYPVIEEQVEPPAMKTVPPARDQLTPEEREENRRRMRVLIDGIGGSGKSRRVP